MENTMVKEIPLTKGQVALVDNEDYERLMQWKWHASRSETNWYARRAIVSDGRNITTAMHREIVDAMPGEYVDHINHNTLDNRKCNLRKCSQSENLANQKPQRRITSSKYKGVCWYKAYNKWQVTIKVNGKSIFLGYFEQEDEAAKAYDNAAQEYFEEFAYTNTYHHSM